VQARDRHFVLPPGKRLRGIDHRGLVTEGEHAPSIRSAHQRIRKAPQAVIRVGVPSGTCASSQRPCSSVTRTQPWVTEKPMLEVSLVEWIATRLPPFQSAIACGATADSASTQQPYGPLGSPVSSRSVTSKRPVGVGASGRPTATVYCWITLPPSSTVSLWAESDTRSSIGTRVNDAAVWGIQPTLPFPASGLITPSQPGDWATTHI